MFHLLGHGGAIVSAFALIASGASAATIELAKIDDVIQVDDLGFACISEDDLELAYAASGKKDGVVPQTCLPNPCDRQIDREKLAELLGRDPTEDQWSDYISRYADRCVAETNTPWPNDVMFASSSHPVDADFWSGISDGPYNSGVGSEIVENFVPSGAVGFPVIATSPFGIWPGIIPPTKTPPRPIQLIVPPPGDNLPPLTPNPPSPSPVPIPGSMALLLGALGASWTARKVAKSGASTP